MTNETRRKIQDAIADCNRFIAKEGARADDLRPAQAQQTLAFYRKHRERLLAKLSEEAAR